MSCALLVGPAVLVSPYKNSPPYIEREIAEVGLQSSQCDLIITMVLMFSTFSSTAQVLLSPIGREAVLL